MEEANRRREAAAAGRQRAAAERPIQMATNQPDSAPTQALTGMGKLDKLPNEIISQVVENCTLKTLLRFERVNRVAKEFVSLLRNIVYVRETARGIILRAAPMYRKVMFTILKITTYYGLRRLLTSDVCERCAKPGSFRILKNKVLCDNCCGGVRGRGAV